MLINEKNKTEPLGKEDCPREDDLLKCEKMAFGASVWRLDVHGSMHLYPSCSYSTPDTPRSARIEVRRVT